MQGQSVEAKKDHPKDDRDNPIEGAATGTGGTPNPVPVADPDPRHPPFDGPKGGLKHD